MIHCKNTMHEDLGLLKLGCKKGRGILFLPVEHGNKTEKTCKVDSHNGFEKEVTIVDSAVTQEADEDCRDVGGHDHSGDTPTQSESDHNPAKKTVLAADKI